MNTKSKIVAPDTLRREAEDGAVVIAGWFDPLTAEWADSINKIAKAHEGRRVIAVVLDHDDALLSRDARTILVAALRKIDVVTAISDPHWKRLLPADYNGPVYFDENAEMERSQRFKELVLSKSGLR